MSNRFDVLDRYAPLFAAPEPSFDQFLHRRDRKRRNKRVAAGIVGILFFVAPIAFFAGRLSAERTHHTQIPATRPTATTEPTVPPAEGVGLIGLPPEGATPSTPRKGDQVLGVLFGHGGGDAGRFSLHMYEDGRLIWERLGDQTGLIEQRLWPEGVQWIRAEVLSTGLFDRNRHLEGAYGLDFGQIEVRYGTRLVRVSWGDCCDPRSSLESREMPTPAQASALQRLDAKLEDPASWLTASAWRDQKMAAYIPSGYSVCYDTELGVGLDRVLASLPRPAADLLGSWDRTFERIHQLSGPGIDIWCSHVTTEEARALAAIFAEAHLPERDGGFELRYVAEKRNPSAPEVSIGFSPLLPHEVP